MCSEEVVFPQIGWAREGFRPGAELGVGDDEFSYAYDGDRCKLWHASRHDDFGRAWEAGDVIGCYLDLDEGIILFTVN